MTHTQTALEGTLCQEAVTISSEVTKPPSSVYFAPIFLLALTLRAAVACTLIGRDPKLFFNQASELGCLAQSVLSGHGFASPFGGSTGPSAFLAPGYPLLVALVFRILGAYSGAAAAAIVAGQIFFGALTVPVLMFTANRIFGARTANIAGALCAASPTLIWLPIVFWETSLSCLLLASGLALAFHCATSPRPSLWMTMGLLCGIAMLVNPALMLVLLAVVVWAAWHPRRASKLGPALAATVWLLVSTIWPIRNQLVLHTFIPLRSNLGYELWQGNRPGSNGDFDPGLHPNINLGERTRYAQLGEVAYMREKSALATQAIESQPFRFAELCLVRFARFWTGIAPVNHSMLLIVNMSLTSIFSAAGLFLFYRKSRMESLLLIAPFVLYPLPYYITHADFRFRLVLEPIALLLTAYAVQRIVTAKHRS